MDLHSPSPFWLLKNGLRYNYPSLQRDIKTDVVIVGAGISGALVAWKLCQAGFKTIVLDRRHVGMGSTAASTSLLQYEIDTPLYKLANMVGEKNAVRSYLLCRDAIDQLENIAHRLHEPGIFARRPSFQYASFKKDIAPLNKEFRLRKQAGLSLQWLHREDIHHKFGFDKPAGILSKDGAETDAYKLTHSLLKKCIKKGLQVYDNTEVTDIRHHKRGIELITVDQKKVTAKKLIIACGYESQRYLPKQVQELHSTFAIASEPYAQKDIWYKNALIWETATPYLYFRTTPDNRVLVGGKDVPFTDPEKRDALISAKSKALEKAFSKLFPGISIKTDFQWAGNFASTKDGLPYIGSVPQRPHTYFALGFGGNGIIFSVIAAEMISGLLQGKKNPDAGIFSFDR
jgi:glycine/D-amino acid oxidase-like deaminating enzyme